MDDGTTIDGPVGRGEDAPADPVLKQDVRRRLPQLGSDGPGVGRAPAANRWQDRHVTRPASSTAITPTRAFVTRFPGSAATGGWKSCFQRAVHPLVEQGTDRCQRSCRIPPPTEVRP